MIIAVTIITIFYLILIGSLVIGFDRVNDFSLEDVPAITRFSIIIPFRNESENLPALLQSIKSLNYEKHLFEILFIDDESTDDSARIINDFSKIHNELNIHMLSNNRASASPKKDAITLAIKNAKHKWIITTDADCIVPKYWLDTIDCFLQHNSCKLLVAPVSINRAQSFLDRFQLIDFMSLQGVTIGGFGVQKPLLCNGANLIYDREFFNKLNGFEGNLHIASGDDLFLLEKALKNAPKSVMYLKNIKSLVLTKPQSNLSALITQRVRWASKIKYYKTSISKLIGLLVLLMNAILIGLGVLAFTRSIPFTLFLYIFIIKISIDFLLIFKTARFFKQGQHLPSFIFASFLYPFFSVFVAFVSVFKGYKWKDRAYSK
ncbi:glycosyltransferase [Flavobacteriales bacterium 34_180_T64]|nr:glycosyltransferase [Flavobacteriales bacterium 34_180_T64]